MKNRLLRIFFLNTLCLWLCITFFLDNAAAQRPDSLGITVADIVSPVRSELDTLIDSGAPERREIDLRRSISVLYGNEDNPAWFTYQDMKIEAIKITVYGEDSLVAVGMRVKADPDSFPSGYRYIGQPVFTRTGDDPLTGHKMVYNLRTKKGAIDEGRTKFEGGYYFGENITRLDQEYIQIKDGYYTTCDLEENPHFHFRASQMKMKIKDKVVAKPVVFYISDVPVFVLPFGVFPIQGGRSSGFIMPSYGQSPVEGRYLQGIGYYWAASDYFDAKMMMDFYDKSGVMFHGDARYNVRYKMNGRISGSITRKNFAEKKTRRWDLTVSHNQEIDPTLKISASGRFVSDNSFYRQFSLNRDQRAQQRIYSSARIDKRWNNNSMTVTLAREQNLYNGNINETLPSISFRRGTPFYPFKRGAAAQGNGSSQKENFLSTFGITYNSELMNKRSKTLNQPDSSFSRKTRSGMRHNISLTSPQKLLKYFSINPSMSYKEEWFNEAIEKTLDDSGKVVSNKVHGFFTRRIYSLSVGASTKIYGMFTPKIGSLKAVRHVMTPNVSFSYTPDFSDQRYGYFATYKDAEGNDVKYDRFQESLYGATPQYKSKIMSFSLGNLFQAKTQSGDTENKFDFLSINSSASYNFLAPENAQKLSDLSSTIRIMNLLNLSVSHSFYKYRTDQNKPPEFLYDNNKPFFSRIIRLTRVSTSTSFSLKGGDDSKGGKSEQPKDAFTSELAETPEKTESEHRFRPENELKNQTIPWDLRVSMSFSHNRFNPNNPTTVFNARADFNIQATKNWRVGYQGSYNLKEWEITYHDFSIYRDLHCWELSFNWTPSSSSRSGFFVQINIKDPKLRDIKVRKTDFGGSAIGYYR